MEVLRMTREREKMLSQNRSMSSSLSITTTTAASLLYLRNPASWSTWMVSPTFTNAAACTLPAASFRRSCAFETRRCWPLSSSNCRPLIVTSATSCFSQASQQYSRIANLHREKQNKKEEEEEEEKTEEPRCTHGYFDPILLVGSTSIHFAVSISLHPFFRFLAGTPSRVRDC